ncbi:MAG TPA: hypothetical protein PKA37_07275, partial [Planctomycetota bacterium]|nr:hypothetical protein [Planctomycetota bacterium]
FISRYFTSIRDAWIFTWAVSAGLGPVVILRWFWWRVNAWGEIGALTLSLLLAFGFEVLNAIYAPGTYRFAMPQTYVGEIVLEQWHKALLIVFGALLWCILGAFLAPATDRRRLAAFVERVRPPGAWEAIRRELGPHTRPDLNVRSIVVLWLFGVLFVYGCTFFVGGLIYGKIDTALWSLVATAVGGIGIGVSFRRDAQRMRQAVRKSES